MNFDLVIAWLMPMLAALFAIAAVAVWLRIRADARKTLQALRAALSAREIDYTRINVDGVSVVGDQALANPMLGIVLKRSDGVQASLRYGSNQGATAVPGFGPGSMQHMLVELPLTLPNQMICSRERGASVFGPFPPPTVATGNPGFDQRFAVFLPKVDNVGYRSELVDATPWAQGADAAQLLANLETLHFEALHVHEGRGRVVFQPLEVDGMVAAMDAAAAFGRPGRQPQLSRDPLARQIRAPPTHYNPRRVRAVHLVRVHCQTHDERSGARGRRRRWRHDRLSTGWRVQR